eukprot:TRINITY_DN2578_c0_g3_i2.p1 TRINITY_DN2578_c0_g3~~TRINITY_DN2578_c0_g3_i2.p1  ORF type:complete len:327 (+),score=57.80 TRINITY_DN2578_c0_g3_i2:75-983(+)
MAEAPADVSSIGSVVRHLAVFESDTSNFGVALSSDGRLYLPNQHAIDVVDAASGGLVIRWGTIDEPGKAVVGQPAQFYAPWGVAVGEKQGFLYVSDYFNHCVVVVRLSDGIVEAVWGSRGSGEHQLQHPRGLAYCPATDLLYVADCNNNRVKVLRGSDGQCVQVLGPGQGAGRQLFFPSGVAVDAHQVYVADTGNERVVVYAKHSGEYLFHMGDGRGEGDTQFFQPWAVSVDSEAGMVYVADCYNHRVCVYRGGDGSYVRHFKVMKADNTSEAQPNSVTWDAQARVLYVSVQNSTTICVFGC